MWRRVLAGLVLLGMTAGESRAAPDTDALMVEVSTLMTSGSMAAVERLATTALEADNFSAPQRAQLFVDRGLARAQRGDNADALVDFTHGLELHALTPMEQARGLFARGVSLEAVGRDDDALGDYSAALKLSPRLSPALNNRANLWRRRGRVADAKRDYLAALTAVDLRPEFSYFGLGQLAEMTGDRRQARAFYAKAVSFNPGYQEARARLKSMDNAPDLPEPQPPSAAPGQVVLRPPQAVRLHMPSPARISAKPSPQPPLRLRPAIIDRAGAGGSQIQLGAWRSQQEAEEGWKRTQRRAQGLLKGLEPHILPVDLPGRGRYYRLRVSGSAALCPALEGLGIECMAAHD